MRFGTGSASLRTQPELRQHREISAFIAREQPTASKAIIVNAGFLCAFDDRINRTVKHDNGCQCLLVALRDILHMPNRQVDLRGEAVIKVAGGGAKS
jgi:hypothetical protein